MNGTEFDRRLGLRHMHTRSSTESHRAASSLELLFDLCFVVAVATAAYQLHHAVIAGHTGSGLGTFAVVFFAVWWAWMNFTWFGAEFDTDDWMYRLLTLIQMAGVLVLAAGIAPAFSDNDYTVLTIGYAIMRIPVVLQWVRAGSSEPSTRRRATWFAISITVLTLLWLARLSLPASWAVATFAVLAVGEVAVPAIAERRDRISYHLGHVAERFGLFTLIVLGEAILAVTNAFIAGFTESDEPLELAGLAFAALVMVFGMWWLYFDQDSQTHSMDNVIRWSYGHYLIFLSAAAMSAGLEATIDHELQQQTSVAETGHGEGTVAETAHHISGLDAALLTNISVAVFVLAVWIVLVRSRSSVTLDAIFPAGALTIVAAAFTPWPTEFAAAAVAAMVVVTVVRTVRAERAASPAAAAT